MRSTDVRDLVGFPLLLLKDLRDMRFVRPERLRWLSLSSANRGVACTTGADVGDRGLCEIASRDDLGARREQDDCGGSQAVAP
eukprot:21767-Eustigmatos_ZCMA.PRE.1